MSTIRPAAFHQLRKPACCSNGGTRSMKNGNSSLKLTNDSVTPSISAETDKLFGDPRRRADQRMRAEARGVALALAEDPGGINLTVPARHVHVIVDSGGVDVVDGMVLIESPSLKDRCREAKRLLSLAYMLANAHIRVAAVRCYRVTSALTESCKFCDHPDRRSGPHGRLRISRQSHVWDHPEGVSACRN
jgi:hypothetical protein